MITLTRAQREALARVHARVVEAQKPSQKPISYRRFRRTVHYACFDNVVMVPFAGMWLGIERDGYTHS